MTNEIRPALSAEEWAQRRTPLGNTDGTSFIDVGYSDGLCVGGSGTYHEVLNRHGTAALALYGQPFGFTWDDVDMLRQPYINMPNLAARIASLLPPREEG